MRQRFGLNSEKEDEMVPLLQIKSSGSRDTVRVVYHLQGSGAI